MTQTRGGGDLFSASTYSQTGGNFHLSFEYLGTCNQGQSCGGYLGFNNGAGET